MLGLSSSLVKGGASLLTFVKDNLKLYLDFKSNKSDTLKFPSEGSTAYSSSTSTYINFGDNDTLDMGTSSFTLAGWVKLGANDGTARMMLGKTQNASGAKWSFGVNASEQAFISISDGSTSANETGATTISIGEWAHVVGVYDTDADTLSVFLNGVQDATMSASGIGSLSNSLDLRSGRGAEYPYNYNRNFEVCNLAIWKRALEPEEIQSIQNKSYNQLKGVEKTSLVSWWALDTETLSDNLATSWANGAGDAEVFNTDGANIVSLVNSSGQVNVTTNSFATRYRVYKVSYDYTLVSGDHPFFFTATNTSQDGNVPVSSTFASLGSSWYFTADTGTNFAIWRGSNFSIIVDNFSIQEVISADSHGNNTGYYSSVKSSAVSSHNSATTTTSVYGGNAPILPRAVDVAKEGQADAIGNGSLTTSSGGYADLGNDSLIQFGNSFSVSCWFKTTDTTATNEMVIAKADDGVSAGWLIRLNSSRKLDFSYLHNASGGSGVVISDTGSAVNDGEWYHVAFVHESGVGNRAYKNGILIGSNSTGTDLGSHTPNLHVGNQDFSTPRALDGSFAQVGLWQGALTQVQIQSVMESTSYSKIPADVKSTLGSNVLTHDFSDGSGVNLGSYPSSDVTFNGKMVLNGPSSGTSNYPSLSHVGYSWNTSDLIKVTIVCSSYTSGSFTHQGGSALTSVSFGIGSSNGVGTHTWYFVTDGAGSFQFRAVNPVMTIDSITAQVVYNDIVAYYPLDGDNSIPALSFDGTDDTIQTSAHDTLVDTTYTFWAKSDVTGANGGLFGHGGVTKSSFHFNYFGATGGARFFLGGNYFKKWDIDEQDDGQWHHYAIIADADSIADTKLYVDGVEKTASTTSSSGNPEAFTQSLTIGSDAINGNEWEGYIAQFAVYSDLKDADFIKAQYDKAIDADFSSDTNLVGYWKMNNGTTVNDLSGNGNNGTVSGATLIQNAVALDSTDNNNDGSLN